MRQSRKVSSMAEEFITRVGGKYHPADVTEYYLGTQAGTKPGVTAKTTVGWFGFEPGMSPRDYFRRIRPQEAVRLDELTAQIEALRSQQKAAQTEAWKKAHIVSLAELKRLAAEGGATWAERTRLD